MGLTYDREPWASLGPSPEEAERWEAEYAADHQCDTCGRTMACGRANCRCLTDTDVCRCAYPPCLSCGGSGWRGHWKCPDCGGSGTEVDE